MRFYKFISVILHPIVVPTIGVILYFLLIQNRLQSNQRLAVLGLIFTATYLIPIYILLLFKKLKLIESFKVENIKERKIPVLVMIVLFYLLAITFVSIPNLTDLGLLFYTTSFGLGCVYILFAFQIKASIHLLSLGITTGFFLLMASLYSQNFSVLLIICILLSGTLASARLHLKAHTPTEVYFGFFLGFFSPIVMYWWL